jgi:hypothetical protein
MTMSHLSDSKKVLVRLLLLSIPLLFIFQNCEAPELTVQSQNSESKALAAAPVSAVMDFYDEILAPFPERYLSLDRLRQRVLAYKEMGVTRIYFRINSAGIASYRSALGSHFLGDQTPYSDQLQATLDQYDPLQELVQFAHAQGLQIFAWFRPYDMTCSTCFYLDPESVGQYGRFPMADPFYLRNPSLQRRSKAAARAAKDGKTFGITRVVLQTTSTAPRMAPEDIRIGSYREASQYDTTPSGEVADPEWAVITQRNVRALAGGGLAYEFIFSTPLKHGFIVIDHPYVDNGGAASFINTPDKMIRLYSGSDEVIPSHICLSKDLVGSTRNSSSCSPPSAWSSDKYRTALDYGDNGRPRRLIIYTHEDYAVGVPSYSHPEAKAHELQLLRELVHNYDIDGLAVDLNTHTYIFNPEDQADFSEPVVQTYESLYGASAFADTAATRVRLDMIRFDFFRQFLRDIRSLIGSKSLQLMLPPRNQEALVSTLQVGAKVSFYKQMGLTSGNDAQLKGLIDEGTVDRFILWGPEDVSIGKYDGKDIEPVWNTDWENEFDSQFAVVGDASQPRHLLYFNMGADTSGTAFYSIVQKALAEPRFEGIILYETKELANEPTDPNTKQLLNFRLTAHGIRLKQITHPTPPES